MIKFKDDYIIYSKYIKTNKHKKLLINFKLKNYYYLNCYKVKFKTWENLIKTTFTNRQFKNNIITEQFFIN